MFRDFMEAMNQRFQHDGPVRERNGAINDSLAFSGRNKSEEQAASTRQRHPRRPKAYSGVRARGGGGG